MPLGTYPQDLPSQEILSGIQLLIIHQEVHNPRLQDVDFGRRRGFVLIHKPTGQETRHQIRRVEHSTVPGSQERLCTPNTATSPRAGSNPAQIHSLLHKDTHPKGASLRKMGARRSGSIQLVSWGGDMGRLWSCLRAGSGLLQLSCLVQAIFPLFPHCLLFPNNYSPVPRP